MTPVFIATLKEMFSAAIEAYKGKPVEAPASVNIKFKDHNGLDVMLTIRDNDPQKLWGNYLKFSGLIAGKRKGKPEKAQPAEVVSIGSDSPADREIELTIDQKPESPPPLPEGENLTFEIESLQGLARGHNIFWYAWGGAPFDNGQKCPVPLPIFQEALTNQTISELVDVALEKNQVYSVEGLTGHYIIDESGAPQMTMIISD